MKRVQVEPHLSVTGACSAEWVPIRPKTDAAFLYALVHVMLHEHPRTALDVEFLKVAHRVAVPRRAERVLLARSGDAQSRCCGTSSVPRRFRTTRRGPIPRSRGGYDADAIEIGPDGEVLAEGRLHGETGFSKLVAHMRPYSPEWAEPICDVGAAVIHGRASRGEFLAEACIGQTIRDRRRDAPVPPGRDHARQDGQQRLGRVRMLLGAHGRRHAGSLRARGCRAERSARRSG